MKARRDLGDREVYLHMSLHSEITVFGLMSKKNKNSPVFSCRRHETRTEYKINTRLKFLNAPPTSHSPIFISKELSPVKEDDSLKQHGLFEVTTIRPLNVS